MTTPNGERRSPEPMPAEIDRLAALIGYEIPPARAGA
jgi:hypothetical protein